MSPVLPSLTSTSTTPDPSTTPLQDRTTGPATATTTGESRPTTTVNLLEEGSSDSGQLVGVVVGAVVAAVAFVLIIVLVILLVFILTRRRRGQKLYDVPTSPQPQPRNMDNPVYTGGKKHSTPVHPQNMDNPVYSGGKYRSSKMIPTACMGPLFCSLCVVESGYCRFLCAQPKYTLL